MREHSQGNPTGREPEGSDVLDRFTCKLCGGVDRHEPNCEVFRCPHCNVTPDDAVRFGHLPDCPNYMRARHDGAALFDEIEQRITRYVFIGEHERAVIIAFIVHCHTIDAFTTTPRIKVTSPEENCGKSLLAVDVMGPLLPAGSVLSVSITPAALYRKLNGKTPPTFVLDEFDNTLGRKGALDSETQSTLLAVLNSGYKKGATVDRCVPPSYESVAFPVFAPVVVVGIRPALSKPFETRTIPIEMQRPLPDEQPDVFEWSKETMAESETARRDYGVGRTQLRAGGQHQAATAGRHHRPESRMLGAVADGRRSSRRGLAGTSPAGTEVARPRRPRRTRRLL